MLQAGLIVAGWDARDGGSVFGVPLGGTLVKVPFTLGAAPGALPALAPHILLPRQCSQANWLVPVETCRGESALRVAWRAQCLCPMRHSSSIAAMNLRLLPV